MNQIAMSSLAEPPGHRADAAAIAKTHLHLWKDRLIFTTRHIVSDLCSRPAVGILIGTDGDVGVATSTGLECRGRALLVAPNVERSLAARNGCYSLILDPVHPLHRHLRRSLLDGHDVVDISACASAEVIAMAAKAIRGLDSYTESFRISEHMLRLMFPAMDRIRPTDERMEAVADFLRTNVPKNVPLQTVADIAGLSPGRVTHLFSEEFGLSLRSYLMWIRMRRAGELFLRKESLTDIAHAIGFFDSAHLSRVFKNYFALTPSFLADPARVEFNVCDIA